MRTWGVWSGKVVRGVVLVASVLVLGWCWCWWCCRRLVQCFLVQLVQVLRDVPVLEGDPERQREAVEGPRVQQVIVSRVELDRLNGARKLDEAVPEPEEVQPGRIVCPVVHGEGDGVVVEPILNRGEGGEGHHDHDERGDHDEAGAYPA